MTRDAGPPRPPTAPALLPHAAALAGYATPSARQPIDLKLNSNETPPTAELLASLPELTASDLGQYPDYAPVEAALAKRYGVADAQVIVTAGGDDAIDRACRLMLAPGRRMLLTTPVFDMFPHFARLLGAEVDAVPWSDGPFPLKSCLAALRPETGIVVVVSPHNPTGLSVPWTQVAALADAAPHALLILDMAYGEFADADPTPEAAARPNVVVVRTLSKAFGLAGARVGAAVANADLCRCLRAAGAPYPVAGPSLRLAEHCLEHPDISADTLVPRVRQERSELSALLADLGATVTPSQGNFVFCRHRRAAWVRDALAGLGVAVRVFPDDPALADALRISCPGDGDAFGRLCHGLRSAAAPQALLLDMDGVLADVGDSYRQAIIDTAADFGVALTAADISAAKRGPDANNDWVLTHRLLAARGVPVPLQDVTNRFEEHYQGAPGRPGLWGRETLIPPRDVLDALAARLPLAIVTGRPRADALRFLVLHGLTDLFRIRICLEDAPRRKPDPAPVLRALGCLGMNRAWMVGDTSDDMAAARAASVVPLAVPAPHEADPAALPGLTAHLVAAGASRVLTSLADLLELLP